MACLNGMSVFEASGLQPFLCCGFIAPAQPMGMLLRQAVLLPESQAMHDKLCDTGLGLQALAITPAGVQAWRAPGVRGLACCKTGKLILVW